ncbi:MAG: DUF134 domain-containing protein [Thermodesulfovibrionales bacterium]
MQIPRDKGKGLQAIQDVSERIPTHELNLIILNHDELEAMKLCDLDGLTQEQAGEKMGISRGTVQRLLESAREKTIKAIIDQSGLVVED